jgi:diguanylate cyclase (GGDEF)-like protein
MTLGALTLDLRVSVGITTATTDTESAEALITRADTALYDAKKRGRDRVAVSPAASYADGPR